MKNKKVEIFLSTAVAAVGGALLYYKKKNKKKIKKRRHVRKEREHFMKRM